MCGDCRSIWWADSAKWGDSRACHNKKLSFNPDTASEVVNLVDPEGQEGQKENVYYFIFDECKERKIWSITIHSLRDYILQNSLVYNVMLHLDPSWGSIDVYAEKLLSTLEDMKYAWQEVEPGQPTLTVCYLQCPHVWFVFDRNGHRIADEDHLNWINKEHYINQLQFLNGWIKETVELIQRNDPGAIIVMQSDHGMRYAGPGHCMYLYEEEDYDAELETTNMQNILNCVYWGDREPADIEGLSGLNTWRTVLNVMFGTNFEMLEDPQGYVYEWRRIDKRR